jgi:predicted nucleic acid-binding protein
VAFGERRLRRDANHDAAARLWTPGLPILKTNHVVGGTWTFLRRRDGHPAAVAFLDAVESAAWLTVVHVEEATERDARAWLRRHDQRVYSFVDATSFAVIRRERLREALAFDGDFSAAGFVEARPATRTGGAVRASRLSSAIHASSDRTVDIRRPGLLPVTCQPV